MLAIEESVITNEGDKGQLRETMQNYNGEEEPVELMNEANNAEEIIN